MPDDFNTLAAAGRLDDDVALALVLEAKALPWRIVTAETQQQAILQMQCLVTTLDALTGNTVAVCAEARQVQACGEQRAAQLLQLVQASEAKAAETLDLLRQERRAHRRTLGALLLLLGALAWRALGP